MVREAFGDVHETELAISACFDDYIGTIIIWAGVDTHLPIADQIRNYYDRYATYFLSNIVATVERIRMRSGRREGWCGGNGDVLPNVGKVAKPLLLPQTENAMLPTIDNAGLGCRKEADSGEILGSQGQC